MSSHATKIRPAASSAVGNVATEAELDRAAMPAPGEPGFNDWVTAEIDRMRQGDLDAAALEAAKIESRPAERVVIFGKSLYNPPPSHEEQVRMRERIAAPIKDTAAAASILNGAAGTGLAVDFADLAASQGLTLGQLSGKLRGVMAAALYFADASTAELRRLKDPAAVEAVAAAIVARMGIARLEELKAEDAKATEYTDWPKGGRVFSKIGRYLAGVDAAYRWQWQRLEPCTEKA
jgi:hypothetical protein